MAPKTRRDDAEGDLGRPAGIDQAIEVQDGRLEPAQDGDQVEAQRPQDGNQVEAQRPKDGNQVEAQRSKDGNQVGVSDSKSCKHAKHNDFKWKCLTLAAYVFIVVTSIATGASARVRHRRHQKDDLQFLLVVWTISVAALCMGKSAHLGFNKLFTKAKTKEDWRKHVANAILEFVMLVPGVVLAFFFLKDIN